ncbi:hypothetical protein DFH09DRAFT_1224649 [Mycena vulgaris]|nr:hypothetical protein DFH09DRAFT_1224649 [Mycena vulgaris]
MAGYANSAGYGNGHRWPRAESGDVLALGGREGERHAGREGGGGRGRGTRIRGRGGRIESTTTRPTPTRATGPPLPSGSPPLPLPPTPEVQCRAAGTCSPRRTASGPTTTGASPPPPPTTSRLTASAIWGDAKAGKAGEGGGRDRSPCDNSDKHAQHGVGRPLPSPTQCVEKWGPGPLGPGTVCDRCHKKMKRVERRGTLEQQAASAAFTPTATSTSFRTASGHRTDTLPSTPYREPAQESSMHSSLASPSHPAFASSCLPPSHFLVPETVSNIPVFEMPSEWNWTLR